MRIIAHLDMDAFFAAVEERDNPEFADKPIVVGADPMVVRAANGELRPTGRGVVSTANYAARKYKIGSAMPISQAWRHAQYAKQKGEEIIFLPVDMEKYHRISANVMEILREHAPAVEQVSVDEAYLDLSFAGSFAKAKEIALNIKEEIKKKENLTSTVGIGPNKLIAKIASGVQKPDGLTIVDGRDVGHFLEPLPIRKIPGIGPKTEFKLHEKGIQTVLDLKRVSQEEMGQMFGKWGLDLYEKARGHDDSPVSTVPEPAKSIGEQETFQEDTLDSNIIFEKLNQLSVRVMDRFKPSGFKNYKTVGIAVRFSDFQTVTRVRTLDAPASSLAILKKEVMKLILPFLDKRENPRLKPIRLLGVRIEKLE